MKNLFADKHYNALAINKEIKDMNIDYKVGDFIYDADIYDGLNKFLSDLEFYKNWLPKKKGAKIFEFCCGTGRLRIQIERYGFEIKGVNFTSSIFNGEK